MDKIADGFRGERAIVVPYSVRHFQFENQLTCSLFITHIGYYPNAKYHFRNQRNLCDYSLKSPIGV